MRPLRVLFIEDTEDDVELISRELEKASFRVDKKQIDSIESLQPALTESWDIIVADYNLPGFNGMDALKIAKELAPQTPFIILSGQIGEETAVDLMRAGAKDFISKSSLSRLIPAVQRELSESERLRRLEFAEEKLDEAKVNFQLMVESLKDYAIIMLCPKGNVTSWNVGAKRIFGYEEHEILGRHFSVFLTQEDIERKVDASKIERATRDGQITEDLWHVRKNGERFWASGTVAKLEDSSGQLKGFTKILRDNTDSKRAEEEVYEAKLKAEAANRAKTQFLANMSHEIRTPLGAILGFTELSLSSIHNPADLMNCLYSIQRNGRQLMRLIDDLLDMTKVEAGKMDAEKIEVSLSEILHEIYSAFYLRAESKGVRFLIEFETPIPSMILSDPTRIKQILMNLIGNAIKFTDVGVVKLKVRREPGARPGAFDHLIFRVKDTGIGISPEHINRLFKPFTQAETSTTRRFGGTGLGLAISHKLAAILGGELTLESTSFGKGSIFTFKVPIDPMNDGSFIEAFEISRDWEPLSPAPADNRLEGIKVLLVDDSPDNQVLISRFIRSVKGQVEIAGNGLQAVDMAKSGLYDVVLMDIQMPQLNGYQAAERLRELGYNKPIIALTAYALPDEKARCLDAGCDDHLTKPIDRNLLFDKIAYYARASAKAAAIAPLQAIT